MSTNAMNSGGAATGPVKQIVIGLTAVAVLYLFLGSIELVNSYFNRLQGNRTELLPITYSTANKTFQLPQNPNLSNSLLVQPSTNELTGIEFSYSFLINIPQSSYTGSAGLQHIFHKGSPSQFPLLGPGVYMHGDSNTLRVYMSTYDTWNNYVDVDNIPVGKWAHIVIVCKASHLEVFVNGNIKSRLGFDLTPPYQNYGDVYAFSQRRFTLLKSKIPSLADDFIVSGAVNGQFSRLFYFNYALSYSEINSLFNQGPSSTVDSVSGSTNTQTYLADTWWTADFNSA
jgi:hypothetical protein